MVGGLLGWQVLLPTLFLASLQGSLIGITLLIVDRRRAATHDDDEEQQGPLRHARIPFGPYLSLAALELLALRQRIMRFFPYLR